MRRIVKCTACSKQYIAQKWDEGRKINCVCGTAIDVEVKPIEDHAQVVRCSSCGAARKAEEPACGFCGSDFTLHEKDMHTICPSCFTRISDKAQYCHHCGDSIHPVDEVDTLSDKSCPSCSTDQESVQLKSRSLTEYDFNFLECNRCAGMWWSHDVFRKLQSKNKKKEILLTGPRSGPSIEEHSKNAGFKYRKCPDCSELMLRKQLVPRTGVILDVCGIHGLWFDHKELEDLLRILREGGFRTVGTPHQAAVPKTKKKRRKNKPQKKEKELNIFTVIEAFIDLLD